MGFLLTGLRIHDGNGGSAFPGGILVRDASTVTDMAREESVFGFPGVEWNWSDLDGYLAAVRAQQPATNILSLVGRNTVRRLVVGSAGTGRSPAIGPDRYSQHDHDSARDESGALRWRRLTR